MREPFRSRADRDLFHGRRDERGVRAGGNHAEVGSIGLAQAIDPAHGDAKSVSVRCNSPSAHCGGADAATGSDGSAINATDDPRAAM